MTATYHHNKMVLRESVDRTGQESRLILLEPHNGSPRSSVEYLARASEWPAFESNDGAEDAAYRCYRLWGAAPGLWVLYLEDLTTRASVLEVFGEDADDVAELSRRILALIGVAPLHARGAVDRGQPAARTGEDQGHPARGPRDVQGLRPRVLRSARGRRT